MPAQGDVVSYVAAVYNRALPVTVCCGAVHKKDILVGKQLAKPTI